MPKRKTTLNVLRRKRKRGLTAELEERDGEGFGGGNYDVRFDKVVSTQCTLLDLAISGDKVRGGGYRVECL